MARVEEFRIQPHIELPDKIMVEYWRDGVFVAGIYSHEDGLRVVSKYMVRTLPGGGFPASVIIELAKG